MKINCMICTVLFVCLADTCQAQFPDQFYTNGTHINVWKIERGQKSILWFEREPGDKIVYRQSLVVVRDDEPQYAYYINLGTRKYIGRYSYPDGKYSVLPENARDEDPSNIPAAAFPPPSELPSIGDLLTDSNNANKLLDPPPTAKYPKLDRSEWDSVYFTNQRKRIKARLTLQNGGGSYRFTDGGLQFDGTLHNVQYEKTGDGNYRVTGIWKLNGNQGSFHFTIGSENLNVFQGEWGTNGVVQGAWSGTRVYRD
jgi:hypothetical protein